jgi:hypothetical protein
VKYNINSYYKRCKVLISFISEEIPYSAVAASGETKAALLVEARGLQASQVKWDVMKRMHQVLKSTHTQRTRTLDSVRRWKIVSPNFKNDLS